MAWWTHLEPRFTCFKPKQLRLGQRMGYNLTQINLLTPQCRLNQTSAAVEVAPDEASGSVVVLALSMHRGDCLQPVVASAKHLQSNFAACHFGRGAFITLLACAGERALGVRATCIGSTHTTTAVAEVTRAALIDVCKSHAGKDKGRQLYLGSQTLAADRSCVPDCVVSARSKPCHLAKAFVARNIVAEGASQHLSLCQ